jgi:hypothetical protein
LIILSCTTVRKCRQFAFTPGLLVWRYLAALTIATMPALMAGGSPNHASIMFPEFGLGSDSTRPICDQYMTCAAPRRPVLLRSYEDHRGQLNYKARLAHFAGQSGGFNGKYYFSSNSFTPSPKADSLVGASNNDVCIACPHKTTKSIFSGKTAAEKLIEG